MHLGELSFYNKVTLMRGLISLALNFYDSRLKQTGHFLALMGSYYTTSVSAYRANFEPQPANFQSRASQVSMGHKTNSPIVLFCLIQSQFIKPSCFKIPFFKIRQSHIVILSYIHSGYTSSEQPVQASNSSVWCCLTMPKWP